MPLGSLTAHWGSNFTSNNRPIKKTGMIPGGPLPKLFKRFRLVAKVGHGFKI